MNISKLLEKMGIDKGYVGHGYIIEAVKILKENPDSINAVGKEVLSVVAERNNLINHTNIDGISVREGIRYALVNAYNKNPHAFNTLMGEQLVKPPTVSQFIWALTQADERLKPKIEPNNADFGAVLNCAVRYAIGRQTYMPKIVADFIKPLIPYVDDKTLYVLDQDIAEAEYTGGYGDEIIDKPVWMELHELVKKETAKRNISNYVDWREQSGWNAKESSKLE